MISGRSVETRHNVCTWLTNICSMVVDDPGVIVCTMIGCQFLSQVILLSLLKSANRFRHFEHKIWPLPLYYEFKY